MNNKLWNINKKYYISLIPIYLSTITTIYYLYQNQKISLKSSIYHIITPIIIIIITTIILYTYHKLIKKENNNSSLFSSSLNYQNLLCYFSTFLTPLYITLPIIITLTLLNKWIKINYVLIYYLLIHYLSITLNISITPTYQPIYLITSFFLLQFHNYHKKDITILNITSYITTSYIITHIKHLPKLTTIKMLTTTNILFIFLFLTPLSQYSPYTKKGRIIYSTIIGIIASISLTILNNQTIIPISIIILSFITFIFDNKKID